MSPGPLRGPLRPHRPAWVRWGQHLGSLKHGIRLLLVLESGAAARDPARRRQCDALLASAEADEGVWRVHAVILLGIFPAFRLVGLAILTRKARGFALA